MTCNTFLLLCFVNIANCCRHCRSRFAGKVVSCPIHSTSWLVKLEDTKCKSFVGSEIRARKSKLSSFLKLPKPTSLLGRIQVTKRRVVVASGCVVQGGAGGQLSGLLQFPGNSPGAPAHGLLRGLSMLGVYVGMIFPSVLNVLDLGAVGNWWFKGVEVPGKLLVWQTTVSDVSELKTKHCDGLRRCQRNLIRAPCMSKKQTKFKEGA